MTILSGPINPGSIVEAIMQRLVAAIMAGKLAPGTRLSEQALAKELVVSRGAVREALRQLEGRKLVERTANIGVRVAMLSDDEIVEIFLIWEALGALAARLATSSATPKDLKSLRELVSSYEAEGGSRQTNFDLNLQFHSKIADLTHNNRLINMCSELFDVMHLYRFKLMLTPDFFRQMGRVAGEQLAVVEAMTARDAQGAEQAMRLHLANNLKYHREVVHHLA